MFNSITKKRILALVLIFVLIISTVVIFETVKSKTAITFPSYGISIVIDAGHGGVDGGCVGRKTKTSEADINLKIAKELKSVLESAGFKVVMTRNDENGLYKAFTSKYKIEDMTARREIILNNKPNIVVSIHQNAFKDSNSRGAQVFYSEKNASSKNLAIAVQNNFASDLIESKKSISIGDYFMLNCSEYPSILCECGYLSNAEDEYLLIDEKYQQKIAYAIYTGIIEYLITYCEFSQENQV